MSGTYIPGMELPADGFITVTITSDGRVVGNSKKESGKFECLSNEDIASAIPVPDHGRLIDADAFAFKIIEIVERQKYDDFYPRKNLSVGEILRAVVVDLKGTGLCGYANAPTIIPASKEGEG